MALWIGGAPGVRKTTVASILMRRHGLRLYSADTRTWVHRDRAIASNNPDAIRWEALSPAERRLGSDDELVAMSLYRERGAMAVADVARLPDAPLVIAEGSVVRPSDLPAGASAVWLIASARVQQQRLTDRDGGSNRLYELTLGQIAADIADAGARTIEVGGLDDMVTAVEQAFRTELRRGPLASSGGQRRELLREANTAIVEQVRGYHARPWAKGDPESVVRSFTCECASMTCTAFVAATVAAAASRPIFASGHA